MDVKEGRNGDHQVEGKREVGLRLVWFVECVRLGVLSLVVHERLLLFGREDSKVVAGCHIREVIVSGRGFNVWDDRVGRQVIRVPELGKKQLLPQFEAQTICTMLVRQIIRVSCEMDAYGNVRCRPCDMYPPRGMGPVHRP